ncbi:MAG: hypothetical protein ABI045_04270 [Flavobacteriales bacterium]
MDTLRHTIYEKQKEFLTYLVLVFQEHYIKIIDTREPSNFINNTSLKDTSLREPLLSNWQKDFSLQYTFVDIHKDDLELLIQGKPVKILGLQGQQKHFLIAQKLAQFNFIKKNLDSIPSSYYPTFLTN